MLMPAGSRREVWPMTTASMAWTPIRLRELSVPNRVWLSPMCQYSADRSGAPTDWHIAHYGARAAGGVGMIMVECTAVAPDMRTTAQDLGLYTEEQVIGHRRLAEAITSIGSVAAVQLGSRVARARTACRGRMTGPGTRYHRRMADGSRLRLPRSRSPAWPFRPR
ncbi:hypothetical protein ACFT8W_00375 [Streptomyces hygroscopicus]|uniref:oxidoreductase n=1 Tax=Streptomyces hygroscopicus TaxID=1912 RepID=UPI00362D01AC